MSAPTIPPPVASDPVATARSSGRFSRLTRRRLCAMIRECRPAILVSWCATQRDFEELQRRTNKRVASPLSDSELMDLYIKPLLQLLVAYIRTSEDRYRDVYLDERLRMAPNLDSPAVRAEYFRAILDRDEGVLIGQCAAVGGAADELRSLLDELHAPLRAAPSPKALRLLAMGDCLLSDVRTSLLPRCGRLGVPLDFRQLYFTSSKGGIALEPALEFLEEFPADMIALSFLSYEGIPLYTSLVRQADQLSAAELSQQVVAVFGVIREFLERFRGQTDATFLVHNASGLPLTRLRRYVPLVHPLSPGRRRLIQELNAAIGELVENTPNAILIDEASVAESRGLRTSASPAIPRRLVRRALFHTNRLGEFLAEPYADALAAYHALSRTKVLLVDFDNTLWEGVMADGPVVHRHDLQTLLRQLKDSGILLVAVSKNDPANLRWDEMTLKADDFVLQKVSWDLKVKSIQDAASELDLGIDSFVFLDDNPVERALVRGELPEVRALDPADPATVRWLRYMLQFPNTRETEEARGRTEIYRQQAQRREALGKSFDFPTMMASLALEAEFGPARPTDLDRLTELVQRTNQFNTTTVRYTRQQLQAFLDDRRYGVYVASLRDRFGSVGLVCVAIVERRADERVFDSFVMSCRAMGFELEHLVLRLVIDAESKDASRFIGRFVPTDRNSPASRLFPGNGFTPGGDSEWVLEADAPRPARPAWFHVKTRN